VTRPPQRRRLRGWVPKAWSIGVVVQHQSTTDRKIGRIARRSHGVVTRAELVAAGVTLGAIRHRLGSGALLKEHPGVYRVGHRAPSVEARYLAAVRACGDGALLSGPAAAHLWGIVKGPAPPPEVTTPMKRTVKGVVVRRATPKGTTWRGIPVTTVPQTLVDLAPPSRSTTSPGYATRPGSAMARRPRR
jgi:hypothetical protein